jgi:hypothetical protein
MMRSCPVFELPYSGFPHDTAMHNVPVAPFENGTICGTREQGVKLHPPVTYHRITASSRAHPAEVVWSIPIRTTRHTGLRKEVGGTRSGEEGDA